MGNKLTIGALMAEELLNTRNASSVFVKKKRYGRISTWLGHWFRMGNNENEGVMDTKWRLWGKRAKSRLLGSVQKKWLTQFYTSAQEVRRGDAEAVEPPEYHQREAKKTWSPSQSLSKPITRYVAPQRGQRNERLVRTTNNEPVLLALTHLWYLLQILIFTGIISGHDRSH